MYERRRGAGAIEDFDRVRFGGPTRQKETQATVTTAPLRLIGPNPDRVMLFVTNNGPDTITWGTDGKITAGTRHLLGVGQILLFQVQNDGVLTGTEIWMLIPINASAINITELIRVSSDR